ncbi:RNA-binding protein [Bdellovibrio phage phi1402]|uniref:RNA-binding protein n=1 Tax=Bdellovibrio phage phi1402 TaxID=1035662 RepID=UPI000211A2C8|nr:RNA-binding protein [Bdellovibrio phage phi1402]AEG42307.1 putative RNA-binding protein [Bdellovibrio phage phi1402]
MKQVHELKIWPEFYFRVANGTKTFEYRENDRNFQSGDRVVLKEWDPSPINPEFNAPVGYTGSPALEFTIGYVLNVERDKVIFSLLPIKKPAEPTKTEPATAPKGKTKKAARA